MCDYKGPTHVVCVSLSSVYNKLKGICGARTYMDMGGITTRTWELISAGNQPRHKQSSRVKTVLRHSFVLRLHLEAGAEPWAMSSLGWAMHCYVRRRSGCAAFTDALYTRNISLQRWAVFPDFQTLTTYTDVRVIQAQVPSVYQQQTLDQSNGHSCLRLCRPCRTRSCRCFPAVCEKRNGAASLTTTHHQVAAASSD